MNRRILITGANSGLGLALARTYADAGDEVVGTDLADDPSEELGALVAAGRASYLALDVRSDEAWQSARHEVSNTLGGLDILVNNAGVAIGGRIDRVPMADWQWITDTNLLGVARGCVTFTPMFKHQCTGHIVNTASIAGVTPSPGMSAYNTVKAGVVALSQTLRHELAPYGVQVSVACPSFFRSNLAASMRGSDPEIEDGADRLISGSAYSADRIAQRIVHDVDRGRFMIVPDPMARTFYWTRRLAAPLYERQVAANGRELYESEKRGRPAMAVPKGVTIGRGRD